MIKDENLAIGKTYFQVDCDGKKNFIAKFTGRQDECYIEISIKTQKAKYDVGGGSGYGIKSIREATLEESSWLEECIKAGKLVKKAEELYSIY
jgi:hypothetical protein